MSTQTQIADNQSTIARLERKQEQAEVQAQNHENFFASTNDPMALLHCMLMNGSGHLSIGMYENETLISYDVWVDSKTEEQDFTDRLEHVHAYCEDITFWRGSDKVSKSDASRNGYGRTTKTYIIKHLTTRIAVTIYTPNN